VIAISDYVEFPEEARKKPSVGSIMTPSLEKIISLHPDLILGTPKANSRATLDQLSKMGVPVYLVDPHGLRGILQTIASLGHALNRDSQANLLTAALERRIDKVRDSARGKAVISVFMPVWYDPVITIGKGAFITQIIEAAGGRSVTDDLAQEWPHVSMEAVVERTPAALLLMRGGKMTIDTLKEKPGWDQLPAVRASRVYYVDRRVNFPSPIAIDALEDLARQFHP